MVTSFFMEAADTAMKGFIQRNPATPVKMISSRNPRLPNRYIGFSPFYDLKKSSPDQQDFPAIDRETITDCFLIEIAIEIKVDWKTA